MLNQNNHHLELKQNIDSKQKHASIRHTFKIPQPAGISIIREECGAAKKVVLASPRCVHTHHVAMETLITFCGRQGVAEISDKIMSNYYYYYYKETKELLVVKGSPSIESNKKNQAKILGDIVRKYHGRLSDYFRTSTQATWLANHLHSNELLSYPNHQAVSNCPGNISQALMEVQLVIRNIPERATGLVEVLEKDPVIAKLFSSFIAELRRGQSQPGKSH